MFRCLCYAQVRARTKDKFAPRSRKCIVVRYPYYKKGCNVYDLENKEMFVCRDVIFVEGILPFYSCPDNNATRGVSILLCLMFQMCCMIWI